MEPLVCAVRCCALRVRDPHARVLACGSVLRQSAVSETRLVDANGPKKTYGQLNPNTWVMNGFLLFASAIMRFSTIAATRLCSDMFRPMFSQLARRGAADPFLAAAAPLICFATLFDASTYHRYVGARRKQPRSRGPYRGTVTELRR